jgi:hypothetical protein
MMGGPGEWEIPPEAKKRCELYVPVKMTTRRSLQPHRLPVGCPGHRVRHFGVFGVSMIMRVVVRAVAAAVPVVEGVASQLSLG